MSGGAQTHALVSGNCPKQDLWPTGPMWLEDVNPGQKFLTSRDKEKQPATIRQGRRKGIMR